jgi:hypothetical protein
MLLLREFGFFSRLLGLLSRFPRDPFWFLRGIEQEEQGRPYGSTRNFKI